MEIISRRFVIKSVLNRWNEQYYSWNPSLKIGPIATAQTISVIRERLVALDLNSCSPEDVDNAIGVTGWAKNCCDECDSDEAFLIRFGDIPGYDQRWQDLCDKCLAKGFRLLTNSTSV